MKDLVISAIANYLPEKIKVYVESLNDCGFGGDKIMICYNIPDETIEYLSAKGWECYGAELQGHPHMKRLVDMWWFLQNDDREWNHIITTDVRDIMWQTNPSDIYVESLKDCGYDGDKVMICYNIPKETIDYLTDKGWECYGAELQGHPHMRRLIDMWWFLQNDEREWNHIITTDVRDIVWQTNPSDWLRLTNKNKIICASECVTYENEPWGHKNIHEGYGPMFWDWIKPNTIGNVGVIAGKHKSVKDLLMLNWLVSQSGDVRHFTDQSSFNFVIHNELIKDKVDINSDFALQVGTTTKDLKIENHIIMNGDVPYVLVHQYDRNTELNNLVINKYK